MHENLLGKRHLVVSMHNSLGLQQPRIVCDIERSQRMHVYLLAGIHWIGLRRLRRRLHHIPHMRPVHSIRALQQDW